MEEQILVSWIGHADLIAMANKLSAADKKIIEKIVGTSRKIEGVGPVKALVDHEKFKAVHLLNSYGNDVKSMFGKWIGGRPKFHTADVADPTSHAQILKQVEKVLSEIKLTSNQELCFHLSPGTPAMAAIWILLAKSKYPATLYQTSIQGGVSRANIPFDVTVEIVPKLLSDHDRFWQHLVDEETEETTGFDQIVGQSASLKLAIGRAKRAAIFDVSVLILGESGTGKELFSRAIHEASQRRSGPFEAINCAALSSNLLESELFGHVKGAFTGADRDHVGAFERADGGTLFLDEVGECDMEMQAKILRVLQPPTGTDPAHREFLPVGAKKKRTANVRVVAATNRDIAHEIGEGNFREDLYYRLATITIKLPPLRNRKGDIKHLAKSLLMQINSQFESRPGYSTKDLPNETLRYLESYSWPGNVRELYNALIQAAIMQDSANLKPRDIEAALASTPSATSCKGATEVVLGDGFDMDSHLNEIQSTLIRRALVESGHVKKRAAELLGIEHYQTLVNRMEKLGIEF